MSKDTKNNRKLTEKELDNLPPEEARAYLESIKEEGDLVVGNPPRIMKSTRTLQW